MNVSDTNIEGVFIIDPTVHEDSRGYFYESFNEKEFEEKTGYAFHPVQDNESKSVKGVLRGLHFQDEPYSQAKLVRVCKGVVFDVAVDLRPDSETKGKYACTMLTEDNHRQFFIPRGFAHGFVVLSDEAVFQYKCDNYYAPQAENGIAWDDSTLNILWPLSDFDVILSEKDKNRQSYDEYISNRRKRSTRKLPSGKNENS